MPEYDFETMLALCRESPNAFATYVVGFNQGNLHKRLHGHLSTFDNCYIELPRGHGKTSQMVARCAWEIGRDPSIRIKYIQQSDKDASKTTALVKSIIESPKYKAVFPHIVPDRDYWGRQDFKVQCDTQQRDSTMEAKGIFGRAGGRSDLLIADDVCDLRNSVQQPSLREQVKEFWSNNWLPMRDFTSGRSPRTWKIGTCYHIDDITADWRHQHESDDSLLRVPVQEFKSPWKEELSEDRLKEIREEVGPIAYGRAFELEPISSEMVIYSGDWIINSLYDPAVEHGGETIAAFDFAFSEKRVDGDPDYSVCIIASLDGSNHLYLQDIIRIRSTFPEFTRRAIELCDRHGVSRGIGEANGPQKGLVQQLNEQAKFPIMAAKRDTDKVTRAVATQAFVESGRLHLPSSSNKAKVRNDFICLYDEMTTFPIAAHDDTVDAVVDLMAAASIMRAPSSPNRIRGAIDKSGPSFDRIYT